MGKKPRIICSILCLFLLLAITACGSSPKGTGKTVLGVLLFEKEDIADVQIEVERSSRPVYVVANEAEREDILAILFDADLTAFKDSDPTGALGAGWQLAVCSGEDHRTLGIIVTDSEQYLVITDGDGSRICKQGPSGSIDFAALDRVINCVLRNETDPEWSGMVTDLATGERHAVNKGNCAYAVSRLNDAVTKGDSANTDADAEYDIEFKVCDAVYEISRETGQFCRSTGENKTYARIGGEDLLEVKTTLGI